MLKTYMKNTLILHIKDFDEAHCQEQDRLNKAT